MNDITVKNLNDVEPYSGAQALPGIKFRPVRQALGVSSWGMNVLELDADCGAYPEHSHESDGHEEVYVVLEGSVVLRAGGTERTLSRGDFVRVDPRLKRKFVTGSEGVTLLAIGGTPGKAYEPSMGG